LVPSFIPVRLAAGSAAPEVVAPAARPDGVDIEFMVGAAHRVRVRSHVDPAWLAQVLRSLEPPAC
jgi:hypothetical protein